MLRIISAVLCVVLLCGCGLTSQENGDFMCGVWVTYSELETMANGDFVKNFALFINNCKETGITDIFVHTVAFCDSIYNSQYYEKRQWCQNISFDVLKHIIAVSHENGIKVHAWINPYRISFKKDYTFGGKLSYLNEEVAHIEEGTYLNPGSLNARRLVKYGVLELVSNYEIDGVHFDDYFYPTTAPQFDSKFYNEYTAKTINPLSLEDYRRLQTALLISEVGKTVKLAKKDILFSVSPAADIERNHNLLYADISFWCKEKFIDAVIPQLYFGLDYPNENFGFLKLLEDWLNYIDGDIPVYIGLAPYKLNTESEPDSKEWKNGTDIVSKQIEICKKSGRIKGVVLFSSSSLFNKQEIFKAQKENIKNIL